MLDILMTFENGEQRVERVQYPLVIGRSAQCGLRIPNWRVAKVHARLSGHAEALELEDMGSLMGTLVNGRRITVHHPVLPDDDIVIGPCRFRVRLVSHDQVSEADADGQGQLSLETSEVLTTPAATVRQASTYQYPEILTTASEHAAAMLCGEQAQYVTSSASVPTLASAPASTSTSISASASAAASASSPRALSADMTYRASVPASPASVDATQASHVEDANSNIAQTLPYRRRLHANLLQALDLRRRDVAGMSDALLRREAQSLLEQIAAVDTELPAYMDRAKLCREVLDEAVGLGPLEPLLADASISEIMVNRYDEIYIERQGRLLRHRAAFSSEQSVRWVIDRIVAPIGRRIDESAPMVDARLPDGSRVNAVIPPVALKGASLTIRKFPVRRPHVSDLIRVGSISFPMAEFLLLCVRTRKNIVVSGGTGSGKTTLLNILSNGIPEGERIVTIEDAAELRLSHDHLVALEARPANLENRGRIDIRDLVRNALRMRPDRIVVGECRGAEAFDMLTAMNTGHEGSLTTLHANSPRDALSRLEAMVLMAGMDLPLSVVREHIGASVDIVVQQTRLSDGRRVATSIVEVTGLESGRIQLQELFRYRAGSGFQGCGLLPSFIDDWHGAGVEVDIGWFSQNDDGQAHS